MNRETLNGILDWVKESTVELIDYNYISEILSSPTDKYKHLEASISTAILHAMNFMHESITGKSLPMDELMPELGATLLFRDGSYESVEFIRAIMHGYERELERYKEIRSGEITKEMRMSVEIDGMGKKELILAVSRAQGIAVIDEEYPCHIVDGEMFADGDGSVLWPVTSIGTLLPPEPLVNYPGDIMRAMYLVSDLKSEGFALKTQESIAGKNYTCSFYRDDPYRTHVSGYSKSLPEAICKAYLKVMLFELNPDAQKKVFPDGEC